MEALLFVFVSFATVGAAYYALRERVVATVILVMLLFAGVETSAVAIWLWASHGWSFDPIGLLPFAGLFAWNFSMTEFAYAVVSEMQERRMKKAHEREETVAGRERPTTRVRPLARISPNGLGSPQSPIAHEATS